jgi:hypothetical protein
MRSDVWPVWRCCVFDLTRQPVIFCCQLGRCREVALAICARERPVHSISFHGFSVCFSFKFRISLFCRSWFSTAIWLGWRGKPQESPITTVKTNESPWIFPSHPTIQEIRSAFSHSFLDTFSMWWLPWPANGNCKRKMRCRHWTTWTHGPRIRVYWGMWGV